MPKIGRNAPCPCGSGKKSKRCCGPRAPAAPPGAAVDDRSTTSPLVIWEEDDLNELSNSVVDLLSEGRLDQAEAAAAELLVRYPEAVDGLERRAMLEEARGHHTGAADFYRKAADFTRTHPGYDPELTEYYTAKAQESEERRRLTS